MRKIYFFLLSTVLCVYSFAQAPIATVDRVNGTGPTATDHVASMSAVGLTRGAGVIKAFSPSNIAFASNNYTIGGNLNDAIANGDYIQWSIKANTGFEIALEDIDIRLRRNDNGPENWQLYYSLDGFTTPESGVPIAGPQTIINSRTNFNLATLTGGNLSITSGVSGTITFRIYAWGAINSLGDFRVVGQPSWAISAVLPEPGIRMTGTILAPAFPISIDSDIIIEPSVPAGQNIDYTLYAAPSGLNFSNSIPLGGFTIRDGGASSPDSDSEPTVLEAIEFAVSNSENIAALAILTAGPPPFFFPLPVAEVTTVSALTSFTGLNLVAPDDGLGFFYVAATFKPTVTDNEQIQITVSEAVTSSVGSSLFTDADAGAAATSIVGDDNRIEVSLSQFEFVQQPTDGNMFEIMLPYPQIYAVDANGNLDVDATFPSLSVISNPSASLIPETYAMADGMAVLSNVVFTDTETGVRLVASSGSFSGTSDPFDINGPLVPIIEQNFDTTTDWTYTTSTFGDASTWAAQTGHFNEIALADATPLDNVFFADAVFGENNVDASGNVRGLLTFADIDVSGFSDMRIEFDWQVIGYANNINDLEYIVRLNGVNSSVWQKIFDGNTNSTVNDGQGRANIAIPNGTSTVGLLVRVTNSFSTGYAGFDNFKITRPFSGLIYTAADGWKDNQSPTASTGALDALVVDGTYNLSGNVQINNFFIEPGAATVIPVAQSLTVNGDLVSEGTLELNSSSNTYSSLIVNGSSVGEVTYYRHVNQLAASGTTSGQNDLIAAPVTSAAQDFLALRTANPDLASGTIGGVPSFLFGPFDNNSNLYINYTAANDSDPVEAGIGYRTASTQPGGSPFTFTGAVETNASPVAITQGSASIFNLIGNPYPSYISLAGFLAANNSEFEPLTAGVYGYDGDALDGFRIWNQAFSDLNPNAIITPGQGFLVSSKVGGGLIAFPPSIRTQGTADDFIPGRAATQIVHLKLKLNNSTKQYFTEFYFTDAASSGFDVGYDTAVLGTVTDFGMYSHLVENHSGTDFAVQSLAYNALENISIPLGIHANAGEQITISIEESNLPEDVMVYLEDRLTQSYTRLDEVAFSMSSGTPLSGTGRFYITLGRAALSTTDDVFRHLTIYTLAAPKRIRVEGQLRTKSSLHVIDLQGRVVKTAVLYADNSSHDIDVSDLNTGVYVVQVQNSAGTSSQKVILR